MRYDVLITKQNKQKGNNMNHHEQELNNYLLEQGWKEGAASPERVASLIERLSLRNKLRMAAVAIADTETDAYDEIDSFEAAA